MSIERIGAGPRMAQAVVHGDTIYCAGAVADKMAGASVADQTREILGILDGVLAKAGSDKTKILSATIWLTDIKTFAEMNSVWDAWGGQGPHAGARHRRSQARRAALSCRDRLYRGEVIPSQEEEGGVKRPLGPPARSPRRLSRK